MKSRHLILNNLRYFRKKNLLLLAGIAISGAVITGALMVGDSISYSLERIVGQRLGRISHVLRAGDRYFSLDMAGRVEQELEVPVSALLLREGSVVASGGQARLNRVQILGVDRNFDRVGPGLDSPDSLYSLLQGDTVIISDNMARRLNVGIGDDILVRLERASLIPLNAPFVSDAESMVSFRATVGDIAGEEGLGRFNLKVSQTAPFNLFMNQERLREIMDFGPRANVLLFEADQSMSSMEIMEAVQKVFTSDDAGLKLEKVEGTKLLQVSSNRVFIDDPTRDALESIEKELVAGLAELPGQASGSRLLPADVAPGASGGAGTEGILTYFVNALKVGHNSTPYSFVSTLPGQWLKQDEIIINTWLATDLDAGPGDTLLMKYFEVGPLRTLVEREATFLVKSVVPMEGRFADRQVVPDLPGLSDVGNCRDWDTGVPIDLQRIRDKDEDYWDTFGGTPKAYISMDRAVDLWSNRFGSLTAYRYPDLDSAPFGEALQDILDPASLGFAVEASRSSGESAAREGVDFSQLFLGLSFFLLLAGIILAVLLFLLNLESRKGEMETLVVLGLPRRLIMRIMFFENLGIALVGSLLGLLLAIVYNRLVFNALNGVWQDVIHTEMMHTRVEVMTLLTGFLATLVVTLLSLAIPLRKHLKRVAYRHRGPVEQSKGAGKGISGQRWAAGLALGSALISLVLVLSSLLRGEVVNVPVFFSAGGLLLLAALAGFYWFLGRQVREAGNELSLAVLSRKNAARNLTRSMSIVILFAIGAFLVISTGSNRKDLHAGAGSKSSGSGGFLYYAESTMPVLQRLNDPEVRYEFSLGEGYSIVQMRKAEGDDASCLNLNKIVNPVVLGVEATDLEGRFSFVTRTPYLDQEQPWSSLEQELEGGLIPAIADETVIKWGLGLTVGDTLHYLNAQGESMDLLLIGGLAPSIFQGSVLIAEKNFMEQYPASSGTHIFLVDGALSDTAMIAGELGRGMRDLGWDMELAAERLTRFYSVTNAYLSIFMVMGALGLLLGTFGLVVVLSRSILERREELAMLRAMGFGRKKIRRLIAREYLVMLYAGILAGFLSALLATLPSVLSPHTETSISSIIIWLMVLLVNGWFWIMLVSRLSLNKRGISQSLRND